ncbi:uncharacterized protein [Penaeus vannamei]|uniref:uncharacterized protein n=1 Tax=Penaeus vannamei TaxID=6689 RepID=UPI00387F793B
MRLKLAFGYMSHITMYASIDVCKLNVNEIFYAKLISVSDRCPRRDVRIVLGNFNALSGCDRAGYEMSRSHLHRWYSDAGNAAKEIDYIFISTRWKILQNCRVYRSPEFCSTDRRLVVATLWVHYKTPQWFNDHPRVFHLDRLREGECSRGFAEADSGSFTALGNLTNLLLLCDTFKRETLDAIGLSPGENTPVSAEKGQQKYRERHIPVISQCSIGVEHGDRGHPIA